MQALSRAAFHGAAGAFRAPHAGISTAASKHLSKVLRASGDWKHILEVFSMQPGSFSATPFSLALLNIASAPGGYVAVESAEYEALCKAARLHMEHFPEQWDLQALGSVMMGLSHAANPGVSVRMTPDAAPPTSLRGLGPNATALATAALSLVTPALQGGSKHKASSVSMLLAGLGAAVPSWESLPGAPDAFSAAQGAWEGAAVGAGGADISRALFSAGMVGGDSVTPGALTASLSALSAGGPGAAPASAGLASSLWGLGKVAQGGGQGGVEEGVWAAGCAALAGGVIESRWALRPLDVGLIAWGLRASGAADAAPTALPLLAAEAASARMAGRLGGANHAVLTAALEGVGSVSDVASGDGAAVRMVPGGVPALPPAADAVWPFNVEHTGVLGCLAV